MFIGSLNQIVITIHKLYKVTFGYLNTIVSSHANSLIRLAQIDDMLQVLCHFVERTDVAAIIYQDDFSLLGIE